MAEFHDDGVPTDVVQVIDLDKVDERPHRPDGSLADHRAPSGPLSVCVTHQEQRPEWEPFIQASAVTLSALPSTDPRIVRVRDPEAVASVIVERAVLQPRSVAALDGLLRLTEGLAVEHGLVAESFAYSMLLASREFKQWRSGHPRREIPDVGDTVCVHRDGDLLKIALNRPERRNALDTKTRFALIEALRIAEYDKAITRVELSGRGANFSSGGDLDEFGTASDPAAAHSVRLAYSAGLAAYRITDRLTAIAHGACVGAGVEIPAFASRFLAREGTTFSLPELDLGLIPGAGGTVSLTRRIGRWRTAYLVLTGHELGLSQALQWGLVDGVAG